MTINRPDFVPFDEHRAVRVYHRNLPHWRQDGATYFITFRLGDSLPRGVYEQWEHERRLWLVARGIYVSRRDPAWQRHIERLPAVEQHRFHKHFNRRLHAALDEGRGACHLRLAECVAALRSKLAERDGGAYHLGDFVVMPNHVHLLICPTTGSDLEWLMKAVKGSTSRHCNQLLGCEGRFWQHDSYDHIVRTLEELSQFRQYIAENPAKAGISVLLRRAVPCRLDGRLVRDVKRNLFRLANEINFVLRCLPVTFLPRLLL